MTTLIVLFNLKAGQSVADYEAWAKTTDVPTVKGLKSINDFRVYRASGLLGTDKPAPYQYVEVVEVNNMEEFGAEISTEIMKHIAARFQQMADNPSFIITEQFA
jgi:REDY-like protein HapK